MVTIDVERFDAFVFDLDGVITQTASIHARAWKQLFDEFLARQAAQTGAAFVPFDPETDYRRYVDGKPRIAGVLSFLARGVSTCPWANQGIRQNEELLTVLPAAKITISRSSSPVKA
jgi:beta-phosphoglucomutase-like phosphatase (HAD superfamily)